MSEPLIDASKDWEAGYTFWLKAAGIPGSTWTQVSKEDWIKAERNAGFRPKLWSGHPDYMKVCATGGFGGTGGISGSMTRDGKPPQFG